MGFLSDLFGGGGSHSQTTQSTSTVTNTQLAGGNIEGPAVYGTGNSVILNTTDSGAIQSATDISQAALSLGSSATAAGDTVAIAGLDHAKDAYTSSLALVGDVTSQSLNNNYSLAAGAVDQVTTFAGKAVDSVNRFSSAALDSNTYIAGKSLDALAQSYSDSLASTANANAKALTAVEDIAGQVSQSAQQTSDKTVQSIVVALVVGAVAVAVLLKGK